MGKGLKFDWSLKKYEERLSYIKDTGMLDKVSNSINKKNERLRKSKGSNDLNSGSEYDLEGLFTYLIRSEDLPSERKLDYGFYRDGSEFMRSKSREVSATDDKDINGNQLISTDTDDLYEFEHDNALNYKLDNGMRKKILKNSLYYIEDYNPNTTYQRETILYIKSIYDGYISRCKTDRDEKIVNMYASGSTASQIASEVGISRANVYLILDKLS